MEWDSVAEFFAWDGALREISLFGVSARDWQVVFAAIADVYPIEWQRVTLPVDPVDVLNMDEDRGMATVDPNGLTLNCHFFDVGEIRFDLWPTDVAGQGALDRLCEFMALIGRAVGRDVILTDEGRREHPYLRFDVRRNEVVRAGW